VRARPVVAALAVAALVMLAGCQADTVRVAFRPQVGSQYRYEVVVRTVTTIRLGGAAPERTVDQARLVTDQTVLSAGADGIRVAVELRRPGSTPRRFVVRFDRAAQLTAVESIEGLPTSVLGPLGISEIFPAAAGAPPDRPLSAGERWSIDDRLRLPGSSASRLRGGGHLVELGLLGGRKVASIRSETRLPVSTTSQLRGGQLSLTGVETTDSSATRELADGAVARASSTTRGTFDVTLASPTSGGSPVGGTMELEVTSTTRRIRGAGTTSS
jgi:hypothetical protein